MEAQAYQSVIKSEISYERRKVKVILFRIKNEILTFRLSAIVVMSICTGATAGLILPTHNDCVFRMCFDMFLQILGSLESFTTEVTPVGFQRNMDANMRCNVIALDHGDGAIAPGAGEVQVVGTLATNVGIANMILSVHDQLNQISMIPMRLLT